MQETNANTMHWVLAAALGLIGVFVVVALVMVNSQAGTTGGQATINNVAPIIDNYTIDNNSDLTLTNFYTGTIADLVPGGTAFRFVEIQAHDNNGDADIVSAAAKWYLDDGIRTETCTPDGGYTCIAPSVCDLLEVNGDVNFKVSCPLDIPSFARSTDGLGEGAVGDIWRLHVSIDDGTAQTTAATYTRDITTQPAHGQTASINFGTLNPTDVVESGSAKIVTVDQRGNDDINLDVYLSDVDNDAAGPNAAADGGLACSGRGIIAASQIKYDLTATTFALAANTLGVATNPTDLNAVLSYETTQSGVSDDVYFMLTVPTDVEGVCTENIVIQNTPA